MRGPYGVPWYQRLVGKYVLMPTYCRRMSWTGAVDLFEEQGRRLLALGDAQSEDRLTRRVHVPRQIGLEESSRDYSYAMVLEHLTIVGGRVATLVVELTHGRQPPGAITTAILKPHGALTAAAAATGYREMLQAFRASIVDETGDLHSDTRYEHPWFGPLGAYQWVCFAPFHQVIHIKQARAILSRLDV